MPSVEELEAALKEARAAEELVQVSNSVKSERAQKPASDGQSDPYTPVAWGEDGYDFRTPGGQLCRLRDAPIEELAASGILDRVTRLPGLTDELIKKAEGQPPESLDLPPAETISALVEVVNSLVPTVVVKPKIWQLPAEGEQREVGRIYVDSIPLVDRIAIMERTLGGLVKWDKFRHQS